MDTLGKLVDLIILIAACIIIPTMFISFKYDDLAQRNAEIVVNDFAETVSACGYVTDEMYYDLVSDLAVYGGVYQIDLVHEQEIMEPEYVGGVFTGNVLTYPDKTYTDEIISNVDAHGAYLMMIGDQFTITAKKKSVSAGQSFIKWMLHRKNSNLATASRMISGISKVEYESYYR